MRPAFLPLALPGLLLLLAACSGSPPAPGPRVGATPPPAPPAQVQISVTPAQAPKVGQGQSTSFQVSFTPSGDTYPVVWSVVEDGGGTVDGNGTYVASEATGTFHVKAALAGDPSRSAQGSVEVLLRNTPANALVAVNPPDLDTAWRLLSVDAFPESSGLDVPATATRKIFLLRGPSGLRIRGFALNLGGALRGLPVDMLNLADLTVEDVDVDVPLAMVGWPDPAAPSPYAFSYGSFIEGAGTFLSADGHPTDAVDAGGDRFCFSIQLPAGQRAFLLGQDISLAGSKVGYLDPAGVLRTAPLLTGSLRGAVQ